MEIATTKNGFQPVYVVLFDDFLMVTKAKKGGLYQYVDEILLIDFSFLDLRDEVIVRGTPGLAFQIDASFDDKKFVFVAASVEEKKQWLATLDDRKTQLQQKLIEKKDRPKDSRVLFIGAVLGSSKAYIFRPTTGDLIDVTAETTKKLPGDKVYCQNNEMDVLILKFLGWPIGSIFEKL